MNIILTTINSKYIHSSFGLRYLKANLHELENQCQLLEFTLKESPKDIAEKILNLNPKIIGIGVYIWNVSESLQLISILRQVDPNLIIILGGPEVSYETEDQKFFHLANHIVCGEGEIAFYDLCHNYLNNNSYPEKIIRIPVEDVSQLQLPYYLYSDQDILNRVIYIEISRGCPFRCEFCLSSLDTKVRNFNPDIILLEIEQLYQKGARQFKFVDRTFNLSEKTCDKILSYFYEKTQQSNSNIFAHFEVIPDRLPDSIKKWIQKFPPGSLQFEIGIQTWNQEVAKNISRRQNYEKVTENLLFLTQETQAHLHVDLIVGLPGESFTSFGKGFDTLNEFNGHEIQVGILKRLRGTPITQRQLAFAMEFSQKQPYEILCNNELSFSELQILSRFAKFWDLIGNRGQFPRLVTTLKKWCKNHQQSFFSIFVELSENLYRYFGRSHSIHFENLCIAIIKELPPHISTTINTQQLIFDDYSQNGKRDLYKLEKQLRKTTASPPQANKENNQQVTPKRQSLHLQKKSFD